MSKINNTIEHIVDSISSDEHSRIVQSRVVFLMFAVIAAVMSVVNIITDRKILLIATTSFAVLCFINWLLVKMNERFDTLAKTLFAIEMAGLFTYFIITGGTDNFSIIWLLMLPALGLFFFGTVGGCVLSAAMLVIMLLCFYYPPLAAITTDYNPTFRLRFPLVYIACFAIAYFLEAVRRHTATSLRLAREKYQFLYNHDPLTGVRTRSFSDEHFEQICKTEGTIGLAMFDIDHFRDFNTAHGHAGGDKVLKYIAKMLVEIADKEGKGGRVYRWGGEEFLILYPDGEIAEENARLINQEIGKTPFTIDGKTYYITISGGVYVVKAETASLAGLARVVQEADENLYEAKNSGRNKVVSSREREK